MGPFNETILLDAVIKASLVLALTAVAAAALRRASASARHLVWTLGLMGALAAPALSLALPRWELPIVRVAVLATTESTPATSIPDAMRPPLHRSSTSTTDAAETRATVQIAGASAKLPMS